MSQSCNEMLAFYMENAFGRIWLVGGPLCGPKNAPFYTESSKKSISLGNGEPDHFEFQITSLCNHTRIVQDSRVFMFWVCLSFSSFDEEPLENILCICPCNLTASRFPDLPWYCKYCSLSGARVRMLGKYLAIAHKLYCFLLLYFHFWSCPGGSINTFSIFYVLILWASPRTKCWHFTWKMHSGEHHSWGDPFVAKNMFLFIQKVVRNRSVWGTRNLTILSFQIKNILSHTRIVLDVRIFC